MGRARSRRRRGLRGGQGNKNKGAGSGSGSGSGSGKGKTKRKPKKLKLNKKDRQRQAQENAKKAFKKKNEQQNKKKTISASQSRRQVRQKTKEKIATRKKINMPSLSQVGRTLRNIRQPMSMLSDAGVRAALGNPAKAIAQGLANSPHTSDFNKRTRDMSKLSDQSRRRYERLSEKTGRDYSIRNPTFRLNLGVDTLAKFGKFADKGWYKALPKSIKSLKVDKQFYGNPMKKGWHSSQRTGRGHGLKDIPMRDMMMRPEDYKRQDQMGPQQDWLSDLYSSHNIAGGKLDKGARDYWSNEAKTKGRDAVMKTIIGTSKAQGTYGGRKKPKPINTGPKSKAKHTRDNRRMVKSLAGIMAGIRGGV